MEGFKLSSAGNCYQNNNKDHRKGPDADTHSNHKQAEDGILPVQVLDSFHRLTVYGEKISNTNLQKAHSAYKQIVIIHTRSGKTAKETY
jgi:CDP-glycerol glycerophosphotransferase (TagB/SpsB family)